MTEENKDETLFSDNINFDGIVDIVDIVLIVNFIMSVDEFTDIEFIAADYNNDAIINSDSLLFDGCLFLSISFYCLTQRT